MAGGERQPRLQQDGQFDQARGAAVAGAERMDPDQMEMGEDRLQDGERMFVAGRKVEIVQNAAKARQQSLRLPPVRTATGADGHVRLPHPAGRDVILDVQAAQHRLVHPLDAFDGEGNAAAGLQFVDQPAAGGDDVVDLAGEIPAGRRQSQRAVDDAAGLLFGQRVALDGRRRESALREIEPVQLLGDRRVERRAGDVPAHGSGFAQRQPVGMLQAPKVEGKGQPWMRPRVCPAFRRLCCHRLTPHKYLLSLHFRK